MRTYVVTMPDDYDPGDPWDLLVALFPHLAGDAMYVPPQDPHTGDMVARHVRADVTVRRLA